AAALKDSCLTNLNLSVNNIGADGVKALATALKDSRLTSFNLHSNNIGADGAEALATALKDSHLTDLNLQYNDIDADSAKALAAAVAELEESNRFIEIQSISDFDNLLKEARQQLKRKNAVTDSLNPYLLKDLINVVNEY